MTTDTPRTDAAEPQLHSNKGGWVRSDFARELEREIAFWKAKRSRNYSNREETALRSSTMMP
jgi:hypothetical protein